MWSVLQQDDRNLWVQRIFEKPHFEKKGQTFSVEILIFLVCYLNSNLRPGQALRNQFMMSRWGCSLVQKSLSITLVNGSFGSMKYSKAPLWGSISCQDWGARARNTRKHNIQTVLSIPHLSVFVLGWYQSDQNVIYRFMSWSFQQLNFKELQHYLKNIPQFQPVLYDILTLCTRTLSPLFTRPNHLCDTLQIRIVKRSSPS